MKTLVRSLVVAVALSSGAVAQPVFLHFDGFPDNTSVADLAGQFAAQGVNFLTDYSPGAGYRAAPFVTSYPSARTSPNVLVNRASGGEFFSSQNTPLFIWFSQPVSGVGMQLGCIGDCGEAEATVTLYDCDGRITAQETGTPRPDFVSPLQVLDPSGETRSMTVDYGGSLTPEAIDDLSFQTSPRPSACPDTEYPEIVINYPADNETVLQPQITVTGRVWDNSGIIKQLLVNGQTAGLTPVPSDGSGGRFFTFRHPIDLVEGSNSIVVKAWDTVNRTDTEYLTVHFGAPATVAIGAFHLTQRGIMRKEAVDIDGPMVAGKSTIVRVKFDAETASGAPTYVDGVRMSLFRKSGNQEVEVDAIWGELYSPQTSNFNSASHLSAVHFWIPGETLDVAGEYTMRFQPYLGLTPFGPPLSTPGPSPWIPFTETKPIRLLIVPVEAQLFDSNLPARNHQVVFEQLALVARTYPVRDGFSSLSDSRKTGVKYSYTAPHILCDGSAAMEASSRFCCGSGFEWTFKDTDPGGLWRSRYNDAFDLIERSCVDDSIIGGRLLPGPLVNLPRETKFGYWSPGAPPTWNHIRYDWPLDDNHNGTIDDDLGHYMLEFLDAQTNTWSSDFSQYETGEVFRSFVDLDGDYCWDRGVETPAPIGQRWLNTQAKVLSAPAGQALIDYNQTVPAYARADYASLWLAPSFHPRVEGFHMFGPGQGELGGKTTWVSPGVDANGRATDNILPNELAHNLGYNHTDEVIPAWQAYVGFRRVNFTEYHSTSASYGVTPDAAFFTDSRYQETFDKLAISAPASPGAPRKGGAEGPVLSVRGTISEIGELLDISSGVFPSGPLSELPETSPYHLVVESGGGEVADYPIEVHFSDAHFEQPVVPVGGFQVNLPVPDGVEAVRFLAGGMTLWRMRRSRAAPTIELRSPRDGEGYAADEMIPVVWGASDPDSEELTFSIFYSPDGERWQCVATGLTGDHYEVEASALPGGSEAKIRVAACDGFHLAEVVSEGVFSVEGKPPIASVLAPEAGQSVLQWESIPYEGFGFDPEGAALTATWRVNGIAIAAGFSGVMGPFPPGSYTIDLEVRDADGETASASSSFTVLADSDRDGMSDLFEEEHGLNPNGASDSGEDGDGDGLSNFDESWWGTNPSLPDTDGDGLWDGAEVELGRHPGILDTPLPPHGETVVYSFEDGRLDPGLETPSGGFQFVNGDAFPMGPRSYIRTIASDFNEVDFRAELYYTMNGGSGPAGLFFGIGPATKDPAFFDEPLESAYLLDHAQDFFLTQATVLRVHPLSAVLADRFAWPTPLDGLQAMSLTKSGDLLTFEVDYLHEGGAFVADFAGTLMLQDDLPFLTAGNSHIFFGTDLSPTLIHELRITRPRNVAARPVLDIERVGNSVVLRWSREFSDYELESTPRLEPITQWSAVGLDPVPLGDFLEVRLPILEEERFFRLALYPH